MENAKKPDETKEPVNGSARRFSESYIKAGVERWGPDFARDPERYGDPEQSTHYERSLSRHHGNNY